MWGGNSKRACYCSFCWLWSQARFPPLSKAWWEIYQWCSHWGPSGWSTPMSFMCAVFLTQLTTWAVIFSFQFYLISLPPGLASSPTVQKRNFSGERKLEGQWDPIVLLHVGGGVSRRWLSRSVSTLEMWSHSSVRMMTFLLLQKESC